MIFQKIPLFAESNRRMSAVKRRGMILCDLLFASALVLSAALIVLESASMLVRKSLSARNYRDDAYALAALIEGLNRETKDGVVRGERGWRAEISPAETTNVLIPLKTVIITGGDNKNPVSFEWKLRVDEE